MADDLIGTAAGDLFRVPVLRAAPLSVFDALGEGLSVEPVYVGIRRVEYLDTHDWRLFQAGFVLERVVEGRRSTLNLRDLSSSERLECPGADQTPRFASDLPDSPVRDTVTELLRGRALLTTAERAGESATVAIRDSEQKLVLEAAVDFGCGASAGASAKAVSSGRVELYPMRGYSEVAQRVRTAVADYGALPTQGSLAEWIWSGAPRAPWSIPDLRRSGVVSADSALQAMGKVFAVLVATLEDCEAGVAAGTDIEFLHEFRVALRRIRCTLHDLPEVFDPELSRRVSKSLGLLGRAGGEVRDLDVLLDDMTFLTEGLTPADRAVLRRQMERQRTVLRKGFHKLLASAGHRRTMEALKRLAGSPGPDDLGPQANEPIGAVLRPAFVKLHRRCLRDGRRIKRSTPNAQVHDLRKRCKRLRYLLDVFHPLYPRKARTRMVAALKSIQDDLGVYQDCDSQLANLDRAGSIIATQHSSDEEVQRWLKTQGVLSESIRERQRNSLVSFKARFRRFDVASRKEDARRLFGSKR